MGLGLDAQNLVAEVHRSEEGSVRTPHQLAEEHIVLDVLRIHRPVMCNLAQETEVGEDSGAGLNALRFVAEDYTREEGPVRIPILVMVGDIAWEVTNTLSSATRSLVQETEGGVGLVSGPNAQRHVVGGPRPKHEAVIILARLLGEEAALGARLLIKPATPLLANHHLISMQ